MQTKYDYAAFFDLDKTIFSVNSGELLVRQAYRQGLMGAKDILKGLWYSVLYKLDFKETHRIIEDMAMWMAGLSETTVSGLSKEVFETQLISSIRPRIIKEIEHHKQNNAEIVILSATLPPMGKLISEHLQVTKCICSELEIRNDKYTGRAIGQFCFGDEKRVRLEQYCLEKEYNLDETYCYADAFSDASVLNVVGYPRCIQPEKKLRKIARQNNWPVLDW